MFAKKGNREGVLWVYDDCAVLWNADGLII